jgi:hypothetical protein
MVSPSGTGLYRGVFFVRLTVGATGWRYPSKDAQLKAHRSWRKTGVEQERCHRIGRSRGAVDFFDEPPAGTFRRSVSEGDQLTSEGARNMRAIRIVGRQRHEH